MKQIGKVQLNQEAFLAVLSSDWESIGAEFSHLTISRVLAKIWRYTKIKSALASALSISNLNSSLLGLE
jgi:hypothetical protein